MKDKEGREIFNQGLKLYVDEGKREGIMSLFDSIFK